MPTVTVAEGLRHIDVGMPQELGEPPTIGRVVKITREGVQSLYAALEFFARSQGQQIA